MVCIDFVIVQCCIYQPDLAVACRMEHFLLVEVWPVFLLQYYNGLVRLTIHVDAYTGYYSMLFFYSPCMRMMPVIINVTIN